MFVSKKASPQRHRDTETKKRKTRQEIQQIFFSVSEKVYLLNVPFWERR
jgi:hypothetical protein